MAVCTFFGHRECPDTIKPVLKAIVNDFICRNGVETFLVGNQGQFDSHVYCVLRDLKKEYPHIRFAVVLAYLPNKEMAFYDYTDTMLPEGIEFVHPRYAISWRNRWLLRQSDFVIAYITHNWGGAAQFVKAAERQRKTVIHVDSRALNTLSDAETACHPFQSCCKNESQQT